jgi:hypothetical protein
LPIVGGVVTFSAAIASLGGVYIYAQTRSPQNTNSYGSKFVSTTTMTSRAFVMPTAVTAAGPIDRNSVNLTFSPADGLASCTASFYRVDRNGSNQNYHVAMGTGTVSTAGFCATSSYNFISPGLGQIYVFARVTTPAGVVGTMLCTPTAVLIRRPIYLAASNTPMVRTAVQKANVASALTFTFGGTGTPGVISDTANFGVHAYTPITITDGMAVRVFCATSATASNPAQCGSGTCTSAGVATVSVTVPGGANYLWASLAADGYVLSLCSSVSGGNADTLYGAVVTDALFPRTDVLDQSGNPGLVWQPSDADASALYDLTLGGTSATTAAIVRLRDTSINANWATAGHPMWRAPFATSYILNFGQGFTSSTFMWYRDVLIPKQWDRIQWGYKASYRPTRVAVICPGWTEYVKLATIELRGFTSKAFTAGDVLYSGPVDLPSAGVQYSGPVVLVYDGTYAILDFNASLANTTGWTHYQVTNTSPATGGDSMGFLCDTLSCRLLL